MLSPRHSRLRLVALASSALIAGHGHAATVQPRITVGLQDYDLTFSDVLNATSASDFEFRDGFDIGDQVGFGGVGLTISVGRLFFDLSGQRSRDGKDHTTQFQGARGRVETDSFPPGFDPGIGFNHSVDAKFDREELNATIGWGITPQFSVYAGYKHSKTDLDNQLLPLVPTDVQDLIPLLGTLAFFGDRELRFKYDGAFVGRTYSLPVERWLGAFAIQSSVAFLDGSIRDRFDGLIVQLDPVLGLIPIDASYIPSGFKGDSRGLNLGISWTGGFGRRAGGLSYTIGLDRSEYKFDGKTTTMGDFEETSTRVRLDLRYTLRTDATGR